jgi:NAD(P)-dependent dehydrogenase (short-subunit alcohol dehydrogenase family)
MNLFGTVHSCNAVAPIMKQQRFGKIITVSSVAGAAPSGDDGETHILCSANRGTEGSLRTMQKSGTDQV